MDSTRTKEILNWKYFQTPNTKEPRIIVAENDTGVIGFVGDFRVPLQMGDTPITARQPVDIMIKEGHRGAKLFVDLVDGLRNGFNDDDNVVVEFGRPTSETRKIWRRFENWSFCRCEQSIRIQHPETLLPELSGVGTIVKKLVQLAGLPLRVALRIKDRINKLTESKSVGVVQQKSGYVSSAFGTPPAEDYPICIRRDQEFWTWRANDPRYETRTYWVGEKSSPNAVVLVGKNSTDNSCRIALQETKSNNMVEILNIYEKIISDYQNVATIEAPVNLVDEIAGKIGMTHNQWINRMGKNFMGGFFKKRYNLDFQDYGAWILGWKWYENFTQMNAVPLSKWEFSPFMSD